MDLAGIIPATVTPMNADGAIEEDGLRRYIKWLLGYEGLKGLAVNMDTGEGPQMTRAERRRVLEVYVEEVSGRVPVLAGIGAPSTAAAVDLARDAADTGADALVVFPHPVFVGEPLPWRVPYAYHKAIADAADLPMVIFQLQPALAGVIFSREALLKLASIPNVIAIKEASFDAVQFAETVRVLSDAPKPIQILTGNDNFILESFLLGADGALIGFGTIAIAEQIEMVKRVRSDDLAGARQLYDDVVQPLVSVTFAPPVRDYRARMKEALVALGVLKAAHVRPPLLPLEPDEARAVLEAVQRARLQVPSAVGEA
ncbi:MAG TPA: dihydrodipicolinate synthase family protein [Dehalococcoidia bacterium]